MDYPVRVTYAGRLDKDSEGLLLLSNDGDLIQAMMKGANCHEKEYVVRVNREITPDFLEKMSGGVYLEELDITTRKCQVEQMGRFVFRMVLTQGVNRQIKRMCIACGCRVRELKPCDACDPGRPEARRIPRTGSGGHGEALPGLRSGGPCGR